MKKILALVALMFLAVMAAEAQSKKNPSKVTEIAVNAATKFVEVNGVVIELYDREGQTDGIENARREDIIKGLDARDPEITFIHLPEIGERAYRFAESLQEAAQNADGYKVIKMRFTELMLNQRTKYN